MARILIAPEDAASGDVLLALLQSAGHVATLVTEGSAVLDRVRGDAPDLLLLGMLVPGAGACEVLRALKGDPETARVPVLFVSAMRDPNALVAAFEAGAVDYIAWPSPPEVVAARIGAALRTRDALEDLRRRNRELAELASTDDLTGLANRRLFEDRLRQEVARVRRYGHPLSALMVDIDEFKQVNEAVLHAGGDRVLRAVARCLRSQVRPSDLVARVGGDEFVILCSETDIAGAQAVGERICRAVAGLHAHGESPLPLTVSVGAATLRSGDPFGGADLIAAADAARFRAKRAGRNRVALGCVGAPDLPP